MSTGEGFLVVLSDVESKNDRDYIAWLTTEHVQERLGIPGFLGVRIFRMPVAGGNRYLIWYKLRDAQIVDSQAYLDRLNNPTTWSRRIMPILGNFGRGGGSVVASLGGDTGDYIFAADLKEMPPDPLQTVSRLQSLAAIKATHLLVTDLQKTEIRTSERELRTSDSTFANLLLVESDSKSTLNQMEVSILATIEPSHRDTIGGLYRQIFSLAG